MIIKQNLPKILLFNIALFCLSLVGIVFFFKTETNLIFRWGILLLLLFSAWRVYLKDTSPILFVIGFINIALLFNFHAFSNNSANAAISVIGVFVMVLFLFSYHHLKSSFPKPTLAIYAGLLGLSVSELFYILTFFPIEAKNKAILIVLFLWIYDEFVVGFESKSLSKGFAILITAIFTIIFVTLALTFPYKLGL